MDADWTSLIPALLAITLALATRQVFFALFVGIFSGAWLVDGGGIAGAFDALLRVIDTYILRALMPEDGSTEHLAIVLFTLIVGGMIGVITRNGGMAGVVQALAKLANTARRGMLATYAMGLSIFFDDYANTIIVGNTMQPLMDRLKVSREKLAFIVDSTAAPVATVAVVTTWNAFQLSLISDAMEKIDAIELAPYNVMLSAIPMMFYPLLMLAFVAMIAWTRRDFGAMHKAEKEAQQRAIIEEHSKEVVAGNPWLAIIPIMVLIGTTVAGLFSTGEGETIRDILGSADPFAAMMWAALLSLLTALVLSIVTRAQTASEAFSAMEKGFEPMLLAAVILTLAWAISDVNSALGTADYMVAQLGDSVSPVWLPILVFIIAAVTAFATGTSWGTMGILIPVVVPLSYAVLQHHGMWVPEHYSIFYAATGSVLAGAVWGDHCSPISDTTILSSIGSGCDHIAHVRTQLPYAMSVAVISIVTLLITLTTGVSAIIGLVLGIVLLWGVIRLFGKQV